MPDIRLPIKVVIPQAQDYHKDAGGGGERKVFGPVSQALREDLSSQVNGVATYFQDTFSRSTLPAVARVVLKSEALAKSHRPSGLFDRNTCPIIGIRDIGELLISVNQPRLQSLQRKIQTSQTAGTEANLSTIERIEPFRAEDALRGIDMDWMRSKLAAEPVLKLKLFQHDDSTDMSELLRGLHEELSALNLPPPEQVHYGRFSLVFKIPGASFNAAQRLARFVGAQSVGPFPRYRTVRTTAIPLRRARPSDLLPPDPNEDYPVVGIIDTGVNPQDPLLAPWVIGHSEHVPANFRDYSHGSFVAGLIARAHALNHEDDRFPRVQAKVLDVVALPREGEDITEDQLLSILEDVIPAHPEIRVWNLSLGLAEPPCSNGDFSDFGIALDDLQDRFNVTFVIAAGNYVQQPFRGWPPDNLGEDDRICPPADSVRGLVVGSIAHEERANSRVRREQPSPFSKRGPGAAFLPKPELAHYGGNCTHAGDYAQTGILSVDGDSNLAENIGTSFATPMVSVILANIHHSFQDPPSRVLCKALAIHSAVMGCANIDAQSLRYHGFGIPSDLQGIMTCSPSAATLIFEPEIVPGYQFIKDSFPIPSCLRDSNGKVKGEFIITLVYDPVLEVRFGSEYCRRNVSVSLGTYGIGRDGKPHHHKQIPEVPKDMSQLYEKHLIEHGFKWSPIKVYRRAIPNGIAGEDWRLVVEAQDRSGFRSDDPTPVALIVTIRDPKGEKPVYDEVVARTTSSGWVTQDIAISNRIRSRLVS